MYDGSRYCDYCDNGCDRCQPPPPSAPDPVYDLTPIRKLLRIQRDYQTYIEGFVPQGVPPITHTSRHEELAVAFAEIARHIQMLERGERKAIERQRAEAARKLSEMKQRRAELDQAIRRAESVAPAAPAGKEGE